MIKVEKYKNALKVQKNSCMLKKQKKKKVLKVEKKATMTDDLLYTDNRYFYLIAPIIHNKRCSQQIKGRSSHPNPIALLQDLLNLA